jgi:plastocyanin
VLTFSIPTALQGISPTVLHAPGIPAGNITRTNTAVSFLLPYIEQDNVYRIMLGWPIAPGNLIANQAAQRANALGSYTPSVNVQLPGDLDLSNNSITTTITPTRPSPIIAILIGLLTDPWGTAETTCRTTVNFVGRGTPGESVNLFLDGLPAGSALIEPEGIFYFQLSNLSAGRHRVTARYSSGSNLRPEIVSPRDAASGLPTGLIDVNPSLPFDPKSLTFTDSQGRIIHPRTLGISDGTSNTLMFSELTSGETYEVGVNSCSNEPNQNLTIILENTMISGLRDDDGDGRYTGTFVYNPIAPRSPSAASAASVFRLSVTSGGLEQSYDLSVQPQTNGIVRDALTQQPVANAALTLLGAQLEAGVQAIFSAWTSGALGQPNPQTTGIDGAYSFNSPGSLNRVDAVRSGYQPYRSFDLAAVNGSVAQDIDLTPALAGPATHTIYVTERGFEPTTLKVAPGGIIEWVNVDLAEHTTTNATWDSGVLSAGQSYRFKLTTQGTYAYTDATNPENIAVIIVDGYRLYLPLIVR